MNFGMIIFFRMGKVKYRVKADAPKEKLEELCAYVQKTSPVLDVLRNPVSVTIEME